ncbi:nicotinate-nucleotide adenylyltransferase-like protein [Babesia caballi]|uniref:Nicotinate-nucleotide adenylyltransferase-like protein n=1 Tax=Babesia caballi TaxID=5871 RepID=A0AAV4LPP1_BABCB|nr:nicotinate-nucleotide adenylyltransferase-like protein [Babesia caballi]
MLEKVLLFAGTFDPITAAHILMLRQCIETEFFSHVWMLPSGRRTDKEFKASDEARLEQCRIVARDFAALNIHVEVCDYEIKLGHSIDSYFTMRYYQTAYPNYDFYFFIGSDLLPQVPRWPYGEELIEITNFVIADREGYPIAQADLDRLKHYELLSELLQRKSRTMKTSNMSSTLVRAQLAEHIACDDAGTLHPKIMQYIRENMLYRQDRALRNAKKCK